MEWINIYGLIIVILMLIPNMIYYAINKSFENKCKNKIILLMEQIGRYGSMIFMILPIKIFDYGFGSKMSFVIWLIGSPILLLLYGTFWLLYFRRTNLLIAMMLAIIPSLIFISTGLLLSNWLLLASGLIFAVSHCYITYLNARRS